MRTLRRQVHGVVAELKAGLRSSGEGAKRTALDLSLRAPIAEAVLHLEVDGSAQRVQSENRIVGPQIGAVDGDGRNEVPVDRVAERLVEADPVHIHRNALRGALHRRCGEAPIAQLLCSTVAVGIGDRDPGDALEQGLGDVRRLGAGEVRRCQRLHGARNFVAIDVTAERRRHDHIDLG